MQQTNVGEFEVFDAGEYKFGIVAAQFNKHITEQSLEAALEKLKAYKVPERNIDIIRVAGSAEIPVALQALAQSGKYDCLLAIGTVIRGETPHFDYVCKIVTEGILRVELDYKQPIGFGILTCDNEKQALERAKLGGEHMEAALQLKKSISDL